MRMLYKRNTCLISLIVQLTTHVLDQWWRTLDMNVVAVFCLSFMCEFADVLLLLLFGPVCMLYFISKEIWRRWTIDLVSDLDPRITFVWFSCKLLHLHWMPLLIVFGESLLSLCEIMQTQFRCTRPLTTFKWLRYKEDCFCCLSVY